MLGLVIGSFINALVYRLYWQSTNEKKPEAEKQKYSIRSGRSMCPSCGHVLSAKDMIPVVSWLYLRAKCRYCNVPISWQYPAVELTMAILFVLSYVFWPLELSQSENIVALTIWLICLAGFIALAVYDIRYLILPNKIIFPLIAIAVAGVIAQTALVGNLEPFKNAVFGAVIGGGLFYILFQVSNGAWIGGGDVKLGFLLGILVGGPLNALLMLFIASFLGTIYSVPMLLTKKFKIKSKIPFGPFLIVSAIIVQLFGASLVDWYLSLIDPSY